MAVRAVSGHNEDYIWNKLHLAIGLQFYCQWWQQEDHKRQIYSPNRVGRFWTISVIDHFTKEEIQEVIV